MAVGVCALRYTLTQLENRQVPATTRPRSITAVLAAFYLLVALAALVLAPRSLARAYGENMVAGFGVDAILTVVHAAIGVAALLVTLLAVPVARRVFGMAVAVVAL